MPALPRARPSQRRSSVQRHFARAAVRAQRCEDTQKRRPQRISRACGCGGAAVTAGGGSGAAPRGAPLAAREARPPALPARSLRRSHTHTRPRSEGARENAHRGAGGPVRRCGRAPQMLDSGSRKVRQMGLSATQRTAAGTGGMPPVLVDLGVSVIVAAVGGWLLTKMIGKMDPTRAGTDSKHVKVRVAA